MADICSAAAKLAPADPALIKFVTCVLPEGHDGPHYDRIEGVVWRVPTSRAIPRVTQAYLTPSADVPACRDEDPAHAAASPPATPTRRNSRSEEG